MFFLLFFLSLSSLYSTALLGLFSDLVCFMLNAFMGQTNIAVGAEKITVRILFFHVLAQKGNPARVAI